MLDERYLIQKFGLRCKNTLFDSQHLILQVNIADIIYQLALSTPVDFKTILHVKFPTSKSRQIGSALLEQANDQQILGRPENEGGATFTEFENDISIVVLNEQRLILNI